MIAPENNKYIIALLWRSSLLCPQTGMTSTEDTLISLYVNKLTKKWL